ncbi:hypothetical protein [Mesorhizobium sp. WSM2561]|uniref:hypothetical protein n=1 Tax=Mesorhizobium sp. WSM2561 TaxID=1040985 RepID=UPI00048676D1|nr:hypothetical protein [Mesorhizobium sp. WSM2561]
MTRKLLLTQKQITAICRGAAKAGHVPIIETQGGVNVRLVPASDNDRPGQKPPLPEPDVKVRF